MTTIGIIDYGIGNHSSVIHCFRELNYRVRVSDSIEELEHFDILCLPGVGAFPTAMKALHQLNLVEYLQEQAKQKRPIIGICLGMQLLASASCEHHYTQGLDLIPGEIVPLEDIKWHIGWNAIECQESDDLLAINHGKTFYFNHSFCYTGSPEYEVCHAYTPNKVVAVIRNQNTIGIQFHPEKSQLAGKTLLKHLIGGLI